MNYWIFFLSFLAGSTGAWLISSNGLKLGLLDIPQQRSSHKFPTPKGGGIGIVAAFIPTSIYLNITWTLWLSGLSLAIISFLGDKIDLSPKLRLIIQFILIGLFLGNTNLLKFAPCPDIHNTSEIPHILHISIFLFLLIVITSTANIYNFMDGINGIAAISGIIAFFFLGVFAKSNTINPVLPAISFSMCFACIGFLPFNFPQAKVFMGDVGSIFLGFMFAVSAVMISNNWTDFFCLTGFLFPFFADEIITMVDRIKRHESLVKPHRRHLYQVLANEMKIAHWKVSIAYGIAQVFIALILLYFRNYGLTILIATMITLFAIFSCINYTIKKSI